MSQQEIIQLLDRYLAGTATIFEQERVEAWLNRNEELDNDWEQMDETQRTDFLTTLYQRIKTSIDKEGHEAHKGYTKNTKVVPMYKQKAFKWIAAASLLFIIAITAIVISKRSEKSPQKLVVAHDVPAPTNTRAVITLADGSKVYLDSASNGVLAQENNVNVVKNKEGEIIYSPLTTDHSPVAYNILFNPRGSKVISLTLSDGTKVWLNSESSLKYPIAFNSSTREVEITGEAYFEVKHNAKQPFKVHLPNGSIVEDMGTSFNINAYSDESDIKTTLIEGSVKVVGDAALNTNNGVVLKPGQQAVLNTTSHSLLTTGSVDIDQVMAWQRGRFEFNNTELQAILKQVSRWYNVDVVYEHQPKLGPLGGGISRNLPLSEILKLLEANGAKFRLEGRTLIVL